MQKSEYDTERAKAFINNAFDQSVLPSLKDYIRIRNQSSAYWAEGKEAEEYALLEDACKHIHQWVQGVGINGLTSEVMYLDGPNGEKLSPIIFTEVAGDVTDTTIMFYGHYDKQPPLSGWTKMAEGTKPEDAPYTPYQEGDKLYGRGGADDGYSTYSSMLAIKAVQEQGLPIPSNFKCEYRNCDDH